MGHHDNWDPMGLDASNRNKGCWAWTMLLKPACTGTDSCKIPSIKHQGVNGYDRATLGFRWGPLASTCDKIMNMPPQLIISPDRPLIIQDLSPVNSSNGLGTKGLHHRLITRIRATHLQQTGATKENQWAQAWTPLQLRRPSNMATLGSARTGRLFSCHRGQFGCIFEL